MYVVIRHRAQMQNEARMELIVLQLFVENHILVVLVLGAHLGAGREQRRFHAAIGIVAGGHLINQRRFALALLLNLFARQYFDEHLLHRTQGQPMVGRFDLAVDLHRQKSIGFVHRTIFVLVGRHDQLRTSETKLVDGLAIAHGFPTLTSVRWSF